MFGRLKEFFNQPANSAAFTTINLLLGAGPIIIPEPFFRAGFVFSTAMTLVIFLISYNSANYIGQAIKKIGQHKQSLITQQNSQQENRQSLISTDHNQEEGIINTPTIKTFGHAEQFGYLYGQKWKIFPVLSISIYLFGVAISKCIMTGNILSKLLQDVPVLNSFYFWLSVFFIFGAAFSFKSIQKTKVMQAILVVVRFVSIALMIIGAIIIMVQNNGIQDFTPKDGNFVFNVQFFGNIFSNLIFSFMFHHSFPGITEQLTKTSQIKDFVKVSFLIAGTTMLSIPITAVMAFGNDLVQRRTELLKDGGGGLIYYNQDFQGRLDFIYYIVSFYVFLNVAAFSIYVIVIRKNILSLVKPNITPDVISKTTVTFTGVLLLLILAISFALKNQIQIALNFTGGIFGCIILFALPCMQVFKARKLFPTPKSFLNSYVWMPVALMVLGAVCMIFNLYETIRKLVN